MVKDSGLTDRCYRMELQSPPPITKTNNQDPQAASSASFRTGGRRNIEF